MALAIRLGVLIFSFSGRNNFPWQKKDFDFCFFPAGTVRMARSEFVRFLIKAYVREQKLKRAMLFCEFLISARRLKTHK